LSNINGPLFVDSDGVVNEPLKITLGVTKTGETLSFDFTGSSPPCKGPMNSVVATTYSAVYLAMRHIFPDTPLNAGAFEPLRIKRPEGTFLDARYPRPVSGCAAEVSQRIAEAVFLALVKAIPDKVTAAPAGSSGNFALGGWDPAKGAGYVMYQISGGGYGGNADHDGLTNGCSTIGISKSQPVEVLEQYYPILFKRFALREGSGGAGAQRGGFGVHYEVELLRGEAKASFVMDHGRFGPPGVQGGSDGAPNVVRVHRGGAPNVVRVHRGGETLIPEHLSKDQDIPLKAGDRVEVLTPGIFLAFELLLRRNSWGSAARWASGSRANPRDWAVIGVHCTRSVGGRHGIDVTRPCGRECGAGLPQAPCVRLTVSVKVLHLIFLSKGAGTSSTPRPMVTTHRCCQRRRPLLKNSAGICRTANAGRL
jgi:hypothetical protein